MSAARPAPPAWRTAAGWALRLALSMALVAWLMRQSAPREALRHAAWGVVAAGVAAYLLCQLLNAYKWGLVLRAMGYHLPFPSLARVFFIGMFANLFLPTSIGGDVVRVGLIALAGVPLSTGMLSVLVQRFTGLLAMLLNGFAGGIAAGSQLGSSGRALVVAAACAAATVMLATAAAVAERRWKLAERLPTALGRPVGRIGQGLRDLAAAPRLFGAVLLVSLVYQGLMVALNAGLGLAVGLRLDVVHWLWVVPLVTLGEMLPFGLGGIGPREVVAQQLLTQLGFGSGAAWSLLWQAVKVTTSLPGGILWVGARRDAAKRPAEDAASS